MCYLTPPLQAAALATPPRTRLDFGDDACAAALATAATRPAHSAADGQQLGWSWYSDTAKRKFGWIITRASGDAATDRIAFAFETGARGAVTLGYLRSYSYEMGKAQVNVTCGGDAWADDPMVPFAAPPATLDGRWAPQFSLYESSLFSDLPRNASCVLAVQLIAPPHPPDEVVGAKFKLLLLVSA